MKDDSEIPDLLPRSRAQPEGVRSRPNERTPAVSPAPSQRLDEEPAPRSLELEAPSDGDDLEFDLARERGDDLPWDSPLRQNHEPALKRAESTGGLVPPTIELPPARSSVRPPAAGGPANLASSSSSAAAATSTRGPGLDLGLESTVWDLDDDLGDPRAAQLNVAVALPPKDDLPWPVGRTPRSEDLAVSPAEVTSVLGLPASDGWLSAPLYFWAARTALARAKTAMGQAVERLGQVERERDGVLAGLARSLRARLGESDRFRSAYAEVDRHSSVVEDARKALGQADTQGETGLAQVDVELESGKATVTLRAHDTQERRAAAEVAQRDLARVRAVHQRHLIERRNIVTRAQETSGPGSDMPPELASRFLAVEEQIRRSEADLHAASDGHKHVQTQLRAAEEEERRALAHVRRIEGKREGLVLAQQGTLGGLGETLQTAEQSHEQALAAVGLAMLELRGEVPVDEATRRRLLDLDKRAAAGAWEVERLVRAQASIDQDAYRRGGVLLGLGALVVVLLLGWAVAR